MLGFLELLLYVLGFEVVGQLQDQQVKQGDGYGLVGDGQGQFGCIGMNFQCGKGEGCSG